MKAHTINMFADTAEDLPAISGMALTGLAVQSEQPARRDLDSTDEHDGGRTVKNSNEEGEE